MTPLFIACQLGHLPVVEELTAAKADVNIRMKVCYVLINADTLLEDITSLEHKQADVANCQRYIDPIP